MVFKRLMAAAIEIKIATGAVVQHTGQDTAAAGDGDPLLKQPREQQQHSSS